MAERILTDEMIAEIKEFISRYPSKQAATVPALHIVNDKLRYVPRQAVIEVAQGKGKVICGTGTYNTAETLELSNEAAELGADGLLLVTPYYNKPPQRGLLEHFRRVADAVSIPVIAYNIPGRTGIRIEHDTLLRMIEIPNIVAVKDSTGDFQANWASRCLTVVSARGGLSTLVTEISNARGCCRSSSATRASNTCPACTGLKEPGISTTGCGADSISWPSGWAVTRSTTPARS